MEHWLSQVFDYPTLMGGLAIAGKTVVIYVFLVTGLRLFGKRQLGQMNLYDLVLIIVLANAVQNSMVGNDNSLVGGLIAATTLLILNRLFAMLIRRSPLIEAKLVGVPVVIVENGKILFPAMNKEGVTQEQLMAALREHGLSQVNGVQLAVLEVDGAISIVPSDSVVHKTHRHYKGLRLT